MTMLPIDYRSKPLKPKYITEETPEFNSWMIFGEHPDGWVDISDGSNDIMTHVPKDVADRIIAARNTFCLIMEEELCNFAEGEPLNER